MFNKNHMATLVATAGLLFVSTAANAITLTLDEYSKTVEQPTSGTVKVDFTGTITVTPGYGYIHASSSALSNAAGDLAYGVYADYSTFTYAWSGVVFSMFIDATDLGLYAFDHTLLSSAYFTATECSFVDSDCKDTHVNYSINVVKAGTSVPEPASFSLVGAGFLGLAFSTRRSRRAREATGAV